MVEVGTVPRWYQLLRINSCVSIAAYQLLVERISARVLVTANGKASQEVLLLRGFGEFVNEHPSA